MAEMQQFGRWGQPQPAQEFGRGWPQATSQEFGRWGQPQPALEFGRTWPQSLPVAFGRGFPQAMPQAFGGRIPLADQGWRSPLLPFSPGEPRELH